MWYGLRIIMRGGERLNKKSYFEVRGRGSIGIEI